MIESAAFLMGTYAAMSAGMSVAVAKLSPSIGPKLRHIFAGASPLAAVLAVRLEGAPSTTLDSMELFGAGGLVILGVVTSNVVGKFVPVRGKEQERLSSR
ncbi:hypothetical protein K3148_13445 [Qipengyuania aurantiaca]|uniref:EamA domain-containing protein n=1 Tax=Qipengyuania aurantiaca TaxID=2867233 RepID=A0ABX8ZLB7_9SPHN|nr:hypothetical protein [Qipengyuania aurantiaca]QZD89783.1 hypothetical protein K3148_13445 [Qipengyuania aurantiaca]